MEPKNLKTVVRAFERINQIELHVEVETTITDRSELRPLLVEVLKSLHDPIPDAPSCTHDGDITFYANKPATCAKCATPLTKEQVQQRAAWAPPSPEPTYYHEERNYIGTLPAYECVKCKKVVPAVVAPTNPKPTTTEGMSAASRKLFNNMENQYQQIEADCMNIINSGADRDKYLIVFDTDGQYLGVRHIDGSLSFHPDWLPLKK